MSLTTDPASARSRAAESPPADDVWLNTQLPIEPGSAGWTAASPLRPLAGRALRRIFATYVVARVALGIALTVAILLVGAATGRRLDASLTLCGAYVVQAIAWGLLERYRPLQALRSARWQWWMTI